jgi:hypothetical protein
MQPRQHEADRHGGIFKLIETRLGAQPREVHFLSKIRHVFYYL